MKKNAGELLEDADREGHGVNFGERFEHSRRKLLSSFASAMDSEQTAEALRFFVDRIVESMAKRQSQSRRFDGNSNQAELFDGPANFSRGLLRILLRKNCQWL